MFHRLRAVLGILLFTWITAGNAAEPIDIEADQALFDERSGTNIFRGDVMLRRGDLTITADKVTLHRKEGHLERAVAEGKPARFTQKPPEGEVLQARAHTIEYLPLTEELRLSGAAELRRGKDRFTGEQIIYYVATGRVEAKGDGEGKKRVHAVIYPDQQKP